MLTYHLERGPAEFVELKIWASSESSSGFGRTLCDNHIQIRRRAYIFRTEVDPSPSELWRTPVGRRPNALPICRISGWPRAMNVISSAGYLRGKAGPGWMHVPWESSYFWAGFGRGAREVQNRLKARSSLTPPESATRSERFLSSDRGPTGPSTSFQIPCRICQFS